MDEYPSTARGLKAGLTALQIRLFRSSLGRGILGPLVTKRGLGILLIALSSASFGAVAPFARLAYDGGSNVVTIMVLRYSLATLITSLFFLRRRPGMRLWRGRRSWVAIGLGLALGAMSAAYLGSLHYIPVSLAALIYYLYPILVSLMGYLPGRRGPSGIDRWAHAIAFGGQMLSLGGLALLLGLSWGALHPWGVLLALFAAVSYALVLVFGGRMIQTTSPVVLNFYIAVVNSIAFGLAAVLGGGLAWPVAASGWVGLAGGATFFVIGFLGLFYGVRYLGPSRAACVSNLEPIVTVFLSITLLGELSTAWQFVGSSIMLVGILTMCGVLWREDRDIHADLPPSQKGAVSELCTPLCRAGSVCLLSYPRIGGA